MNGVKLIVSYRNSNDIQLFFTEWELNGKGDA